MGFNHAELPTASAQALTHSGWKWGGGIKQVSYPISLEVNEHSSSDLGDEDEQEAGEVLSKKKITTKR